MAGKLASQVRGLSEAQFREAYGTEEQCRAVVEKLRWPAGFVCPVCGGCEGTRLSTRPKFSAGPAGIKSRSPPAPSSTPPSCR